MVLSANLKANKKRGVTVTSSLKRKLKSYPHFIHFISLTIRKQILKLSNKRNSRSPQKNHPAMKNEELTIPELEELARLIGAGFTSGRLYNGKGKHIKWDLDVDVWHDKDKDKH